MGTGQDSMQDGMLHDGHTTRVPVTSGNGHGRNCELEPRTVTPAATRDSDVFDSTAADLPLAT